MTRTFTSATSVEEALTAIDAGARPVAGGTDLVVGARQGKSPLPDAIVAIERVETLRGIDEVDGGLRLGALTTHEGILASAVIRERFTALADASAIVGSHATRAQGTIGGNVMNASPAMDTGGPLLCFDAAATLRSASGERLVPLGELWTGPGTTVADPGELLVAIELPAPKTGTGSSYVRLEYRRQMEIAVVGATAVVAFDGETIGHARVSITALAPTIVRVAAAEDALVGSDAGDAAVQAAARAAAEGASPIDDVRGSAIARARGQAVPIPASAATFGSNGGTSA